MKRIDLDQPKLDLAEAVRNFVNMTDVVKQFSNETPVMNRIPCPFHHGHDRNMAIYPHGYKCYVCGASGDEISFVQGVTGLDFIGAVRQIDRAFGLGLPLQGEGRVDPALLREAALRAEKRRQEDLERQEREEDCDALWDAWCACDVALRTADPDSEQYAIAAKNIDYIGYLIDSQL